jgi:hypothetical protein
MKKITLSTLTAGFLILTALPSSAQFIKGTIMVGTTIGTTGYSSANSDYNYDAGLLRNTGTNTFAFSVGPQVGVFLSPRLVLGATPAFNISTSHATNDVHNTNNTSSAATTNTTTTTVSLGPYVRYYFTNLNSSNWFYGQLNGSVGSGSGTSTGNTTSSTTLIGTNGKVSDIFTWNAGGSIGMTHFFYKRIGMDIALGYSYNHAHSYNVNNTNTTNKASGVVTETTNNYTLNTTTNGVSLGIGFHWFLKG